jgi:hypothetical protein
MLNCRKGDRAMLLAGPYRGYIVRVGVFMGNTDGMEYVGGGDSGTLKNMWEIHDRVMELGNPGCNLMAPDHHLQPIRGNH